MTKSYHSTSAAASAVPGAEVSWDFVTDGKPWVATTDDYAFSRLLPSGPEKASPSYRSILLQQEMRRSKGGVIGIGNKGAIAIRYDDWQDSLRTDVAPLMIARGLPFSHALISKFTAAVWGAGTSWADIKALNSQGMEIWSHGEDHADYIGYAGLYRNVVQSRLTIEAQGIKVQGFSMPGVGSTYSDAVRGNSRPYNGLTDISDYDSTEGNLIQETYALSESYTGGAYRDIPNGFFHGSGHATINLGTLAAAKAVVDFCENYRVCARVMAHPGTLGSDGPLTLADLTTFLDYVVTRRDAGGIEVVTPSALPYLDKSSSRVDLLRAGDLVGVSVGTPLGWLDVHSGGSNIIQSSGGISGGPFFEVITTGPSQVLPGLIERGFAGEAFIFEGWCKSMGGGTTDAQVVITDYPTPTNLNITRTYSGVSNSAWKRVMVPFVIPTTADRVLIYITRLAGNNTGWANMSVKKA